MDDVFHQSDEAANSRAEALYQPDEAPRNTAKAPHNTAEAPRNTAEAPRNTAEAPHKTAEAPRNTAEAPHPSGRGAEIHALSGEFCRREVERGWRSHQTLPELRQIRLLWSAALICFALYLPLEFYRSEPTAALLWPRLGIVVVGLTVLALLSFRPLHPHRDWITSAGLVLTMTLYGCLLALRESASTGALLLLLLGSYLFSPCRYTLHCSTGLMGSAGAAVTAGWGELWMELSYLVPANALAMLALAQMNRSRRRLYRQSQQLRREVGLRRRAQRRLLVAHRENLALLYNALPVSVAKQLRQRPGRRPARLVPAVTLSFADIVGFSALSRSLGPAAVLRLLNDLFSAFDRLAGEHGLEKIKTVGDAYFAVAGLAEAKPRPAEQAARMALGQLLAADRVGRRHGVRIRLRIGLHTGPVVAGVIGNKRYAFDVWGDAVNIASRLQGAAPAGGILASAHTCRGCPEELEFGPEQQFELRGCGCVRARLLMGVSAAR